MFTRCRSLSAAEEIKVKQNKGERGRAGVAGRERDREIKRVREGRKEGREREREMRILLSICGEAHIVSRMLC